MDPVDDYERSRTQLSVELGTSSLPPAWSFNSKQKLDHPVVVGEASTDDSLRRSSTYNPWDPVHRRVFPFNPPNVSSLGTQPVSDSTRNKLTTSPQSTFYGPYGSEFGTPAHAENIEKLGGLRGSRTKGGIWGVVVSEVGVTERDRNSCAPGPASTEHNLLKMDIDASCGKQILSTQRNVGFTKLPDDRKLTSLTPKQETTLTAMIEDRRWPGPEKYTISREISQKGAGHVFGLRHVAKIRPTPFAHPFEHRNIQYDALSGNNLGVTESTLGTDPKGKSTCNSMLECAPRAVMSSREPRNKARPCPEDVVVRRGESYRHNSSRWTRRVRAEVSAEPSMPPLYSSFKKQVRSGNSSSAGCSMKFTHTNHSRLVTCE